MAERTQAIETLKRILNEKDVDNSNKVKSILKNELERIQSIITDIDIIDKKPQQTIGEISKVLKEHLSSSMFWPQIYEAVNEKYNGFAGMLDQTYSNLSEQEKQFCCLLCAGFQMEEISMMLSCETSTLYTRKTRLSQKMGFSSSKEFAVFMKKFNPENRL